MQIMRVMATAECASACARLHIINSPLNTCIGARINNSSSVPSRAAGQTIPTDCDCAPRPRLASATQARAAPSGGHVNVELTVALQVAGSCFQLARFWLNVGHAKGSCIHTLKQYDDNTIENKIRLCGLGENTSVTIYDPSNLL